MTRSHAWLAIALGSAVLSGCGSAAGSARSSRAIALGGEETERVAHVDCVRPGPMRGAGGPPGMRGRGGGGGPPPAAVHDDIHALLDAHSTITRRVQYEPWGVETWATSDDPETAARLLRHARAMRDHVGSGRPIRRMDPLFERLREAAPRITLEVEAIEGGVHAVHRGEDPVAVALVHAHARTVELFARDGHAEAARCHDLPGSGSVP